jgi:hypothetical protein
MDQQAISFGETFAPGTDIPFTPFKVPYVDGKKFTYAFTLANDGPLGVTILEIGEPGGYPLRQDAVKIKDGYGPYETEPARPFAPFSLGSHDGRFVIVENTFTGCVLKGRGNTAGMNGIGVSFRFMGVTRHAVLPLPYSLKIYGHKGCSS